MTIETRSPGFIAPEVMAQSNDYDTTADIFSFGMVLYELMTLRLPYEEVEKGSERMRMVRLFVSFSLLCSLLGSYQYTLQFFTMLPSLCQTLPTVLVWQATYHAGTCQGHLPRAGDAAYNVHVL